MNNGQRTTTEKMNTSTSATIELSREQMESNFREMIEQMIHDREWLAIGQLLVEQVQNKIKIEEEEEEEEARQRQQQGQQGQQGKSKSTTEAVAPMPMPVSIPVSIPAATETKTPGNTTSTCTTNTAINTSTNTNTIDHNKSAARKLQLLTYTLLSDTSFPLKLMEDEKSDAMAKSLLLMLISVGGKA